MLAAKVLIVAGLLMVAVGEIEQAVAQAAPAAPQPMCQIEDTNLSLVERDRKNLERQVSTLALQLRVATTRLAKLEQDLAAAKKAVEQTEKPAVPAAPPAE